MHTLRNYGPNKIKHMLSVITDQGPTLLYFRPTAFTQNLRSKISFQIPQHMPPECVVNIKEQEIKTKF